MKTSLLALAGLERPGAATSEAGGVIPGDRGGCRFFVAHPWADCAT